MATAILRSLFDTSIKQKVKLTCKKKEITKSIFQETFLVQSVIGHNGPIYTMKLSYDGIFIGTGGGGDKDFRLIIWSIGTGLRDSSIFIDPIPHRIFEGHTGDITDISWCKSNFILSASVDKTVRLWHNTQNDCLQIFR
jgi:WD40 repeat protein